MSRLNTTALALLILTSFTMAQKGDPRAEEVPLPAKNGWNASLLLDIGRTGIWALGVFPVYPEYAVPEVIGLDDAGVAHVLVSYSGKWTPVRTVHDGRWLGAICQGDIDPRIEGPELYTGGQRGTLYQLTPHEGPTMSSRLIARFPGREIHTILCGELDPRSEGREILVFTRPGALFRVRPAAKGGTFETEKLQDLEGRYRDAVILPGKPGQTPRIAGVTRAGKLCLLQLDSQGVRWKTLYQAPMGMGRLSLRRSPGPIVLYASHDDGRILRFEEGKNGEWKTETIYLGPQGVRGVVSGRFHEDPEIESVAVFGYSKKVQLLHRKGTEAWKVETIFVDRDKGHYLAVAELDGRNSTEEIVGSGYGGRIFMLARPVGYGRPGIPTDPNTARTSSKPCSKRPCKGRK